MPRQTKRDRLAAIKQAASYPDARTALAAIRSARDAQSLKRTIDHESLPVAVDSPRHVSSAYSRGKGRYISRMSECADIWCEEISRLLRVAKRIPILAYKLNPRYYRVIAKQHHRNIGPIMPEYSTSTNSRQTIPPVVLTSATIAKAENILRAVPADTQFPEQRASREWAKWTLATTERLERAARLSHELAMTRQQANRIDVINTAKNCLADTLTRRAAPPPAIPYTPATRQGWKMNRRIPLHLLVPIASH